MKSKVCGWTLLFFFFCSSLSASSVVGIKAGYGFAMTGMGLHDETVRKEGDSDTQTTRFSPILGLQYQRNLSGKLSFAASTTFQWGDFSDEKRAMGGGDSNYYDDSGSLSGYFVYGEHDFIVSYKFLNWLVPFAGVKMLTGTAECEYPVNRTNYPEQLPYGIPDSAKCNMFSMGPGGGIKTVTNMIGDLYFQTNLSLAYVPTSYFYQYGNAKDDQVFENIIAYNLGAGFLYYVKSLKTSFSLAGQFHLSSVAGSGKMLDFRQLREGTVGIILSANYVL